MFWPLLKPENSVEDHHQCPYYENRKRSLKAAGCCYLQNKGLELIREAFVPRASVERDKTDRDEPPGVGAGSVRTHPFPGVVLPHAAGSGPMTVLDPLSS